MTQQVVHAQIGRSGRISRRGFLWRVGEATAGTGLATVGWRDLLTARAADIRHNGKSMILLWLDGGPSQFETFSPKPGSRFQGPTKTISTCVAGIPLAVDWPQTANVMDKIAIIQSMTGGPASHDAAITYVRTGYRLSPALKFPTWGSVVALDRENPEFDLPAFVRIGRGRSELPSRNPDAGCLGVNYDPLWARDPGKLPPDVARSVRPEVLRRRVRLTDQLDREFARTGAERVAESNRLIHDRAMRFTLSPRLAAFDLDLEKESLRDAYGRSPFGQGCLLARRLVEQGVSFIEVLHANWDTHKGPAFKDIQEMSYDVDRGFATLLWDLEQRGMLEDTLVVVMGEFGRTPKFEDDGGGRDHYSTAYTAVFAGGGVQGGQVIGATDEDGVAVIDRPVTIPDLMVTYCKILGLNRHDEYVTQDDRPIKLVEGGRVVTELFG